MSYTVTVEFESEESANEFAYYVSRNDDVMVGYSTIETPSENLDVVTRFAPAKLVLKKE